jgi:cytochrome P450
MVEPQCGPYSYSFEDPHRLDPDPLYAQLRPTEPMARVVLPYGAESWLSTRYRTVKRVLGDPVFSRAAAVGPDAPRATPIWPRADAIVSLDPPEHKRLRRLVAAAFTVRSIERLRSRAQEIVDELLDDMAKQGPPADIVEALAVSLPMTMICEILGVPFEDRALFRQWSVPQMSTTAFTPKEIDEAYRSLRGYLSQLVSAREVRETDDILSVLVQARANGDRLSHEELVSLAVSLLAAGFETTANQIANFTYTVLTRPDQRAWLRQDIPGRIASAVEELLRFIPLAGGAPSSQCHARVATADIELDGVVVRAGDAVLPSVIAANRDDRVFECPDEVDFSREDNRHVAFGYGPHRCLGAHLARMELQVAIGTLLHRFPTLRLATDVDDVQWKKGMLVRGPEVLPVAW